VYPALAVLQELGGSMDSILWVGSQGGLEANLIQRAGIPFREIPAAGVHGISWYQLPKNLLKLLQGYFKSREILSEFHPDGIFFTGGFVAIPMAFAAQKVPKIVFVPDIEPGLALKVLARLADTIAVTVEETKKFLPSGKRIEVTGYPVRSDLFKWSKANAMDRFGLDPNLPTLLVFGGSRGAHSINMAVLNILERLLESVQVIHISGKLDWDKVQLALEALPASLQSRYHTLEYLHEMGAAFAASDMVISRAGASTLGEYPLFGIPAILVPYPYAWRYQIRNAEYLKNHNAAVVIRDENINEKLLPTVQSLLSDPEKMKKMKNAMVELGIHGAASKIGQLILEFSIPSNSQTGVNLG
jgi:undecaprenyldiphospho-muramoylpentapeptide beta-N-acetylglucosaminyltransferase